MDGLDSGSGGDITSPNISCSNWPPQRSQYKSVDFILPTVALGVLNVAVIVGNSLVILAVFTSAKLRTTTNTFVWSLAVADLLVGLMVLPFSIANEVLRFWVFGPIWCSVWLAVDVWLCTASILNLVAISFDRYVAISRPFKYHSLLSPKRGKILVGGVWILSFVICFPPLIGWNEQGKGLGNRFSDGSKQGETDSNQMPRILNVSNDLPSDIFSGSGNGNIENTDIFSFDPSAESLYVITSKILSYSNLTLPAITGQNNVKNVRTSSSLCETKPFPECTLTSDPGYIVYSALGSFWIPAIIMCVFYWKIYRTAVRSTAALKHGMLTTKAPGNDLNSTSSESVTLRIHRGGGGSTVRTSTLPEKRSKGSKYSKYQYCRTFKKEHPANQDSTDVYNSKQSANSVGKKNKKCKAISLGISSGTQPDLPLLGKRIDKSCDRYYGQSCFRDKKHNTKYQTSTKSQHNLQSRIVEGGDYNGLGDHQLQQNINCEIEQQETKSIATLRKSRRKNFKLELQKLNKEKKAAKTVGIIVGCFIMCWLPFFTVYLVGAFCSQCTPPLLFSIFFWLGYCNSAINPCVYALFSRDFRCAFKKLLRCNCHIEPKQHQHSLGFVTKMHSFKTQTSTRSNDSNSD